MAGLIADPFRAARLLLHLRQEGVTDARVLTAMETIDRAAFVDDESLAPLAFEDAVLPIPCGQVILRPAATGHLLQALALPEERTARVLLIGFGSGYSSALIASLAGQVYAIDRYATLVSEGRARFERLGIGNVTVCQADGLNGWPEPESFDRIVLMGTAGDVPETLLAQLAKGGRLVAPSGEGKGRSIAVLSRDGEISRTPFFQQVLPLVEGKAGTM